MKQIVMYQFIPSRILYIVFENTNSINFTAHRKRSICYGTSVCLSVCPSHFGIVSKRGNAEGRGLHRRVVCSVCSFLMPRMVGGDDPVQVKFECKEVDPL